MAAVAVIVLALAAVACDSAAEREIGACLAVQSRVRAELVSPASADFDACGRGAEAVALGDGAYRVTGRVDSQNRLGATLRSHYSAIARPAAGETWVVEVEWIEEQ